jgi:hypothetical protein
MDLFECQYPKTMRTAGSFVRSVSKAMRALEAALVGAAMAILLASVLIPIMCLLAPVAFGYTMHLAQTNSRSRPPLAINQRRYRRKGSI